MRINTASPLCLKDILLYVLAYLLWLVNVLVCIAAVIQLRSAVNVVWIALGQSRYTLGLVDQVGVLLGGLVACIYVVYLESYYRRSVKRGVPKPEGGETQVSQQGRIAQQLTDPRLAILGRRFAVTTAIPLGLVIASLLITEVAFRSLYASAT